MNEMLSPMLMAGEESLCPVYCGFPDTGFFARPGNLQTGFATITSGGRILFAKYNIFGQCTRGAYFFPAISKLKIRKNFAGQYVIDGTTLIDGKKRLFKFQIARKVFGCNFPCQEENAERFVSTLMVLQTQR